MQNWIFGIITPAFICYKIHQKSFEYVQETFIIVMNIDNYDGVLVPHKQKNKNLRLRD